MHDQEASPGVAVIGVVGAELLHEVLSKRATVKKDNV
jgi:hypothetical protein